MAPTSPFKALVLELIARLPSSTSSQPNLVRELEVAVIGRRTELESSCVVSVVVAERPVVGETHPRDEPPPPPPPLPLPQMIRPPLKLVLRAPHGTITHIAGEDDEPDDSDDEETFRDGPAPTARFGGIISGVVATDGALFLSD